MKNIGWIDVRVLEVEHSYFLPVLGRAINLATVLHLFCLLMTRRIVIIQGVRSSGVTLVSTMLIMGGMLAFAVVFFILANALPLGEQDWVLFQELRV